MFHSACVSTHYLLSCTCIWTPWDISFLYTLYPSGIYYELIRLNQFIIQGFKAYLPTWIVTSISHSLCPS